jgi:hypothetical protein
MEMKPSAYYKQHKLLPLTNSICDDATARPFEGNWGVNGH